MAELTAQAMTRAGLKATYSTPTGAGNDYFANHGNQFVHIKNGGAVSTTMSITVAGKVDGLPVSARTVVTPAGEEKFVGPFPIESYNDSGGNVIIAFSAVTSVSVAVLTHGAL